MKKLINLFALSSIILTGAGTTVACSSSTQPGPTIDPRKDVIYSFAPVSGTSWAAGSNTTLIFSSGTPSGLYIEVNDNINMKFNSDAGLVWTFNINVTSLGTPLTVTGASPSFTLTFSKDELAITSFEDKTNTINIEVRL